MIQFTGITKSETFIELDGDNGSKMLMPASQTIFIDDQSGAISVKTTGSRKTLGYMVSGGTPPVPPTPVEIKWIATYADGHTESAECDTTSAITNNEINLTNLVSVEIGDCVTSIGDYAFNNCTSLTGIIISNSVTTIGECAFQSCTSLTNIFIPDSVTTIGDYAFSLCASIANIEIPDNVISIGYGAFFSCTILTVVMVEATTPPTLGSQAFYGTNCVLFVPAESFGLYLAYPGWSEYASRIRPMP